MHFISIPQLPHSIRLVIYLLWTGIPFQMNAQTVNDDCDSALIVPFSESEQSVVIVEGDSRGALPSSPAPSCSGTWFTDDTWFSFVTPDVLPDAGVIVKAYFDKSEVSTDLSAIGMAIYDNCGSGTEIACFSSDIPEENSTFIASNCILPDHQYYIRIWSAGADISTEGTFRVGVFAHIPATPILWRETFNGGLEANGWTTEGTCATADSNINAGWKYLPDGLLDKGGFAAQGMGISSPSLCDGAVGVDSDYDDNAGSDTNLGNGPCPAPAQHILLSPEINSSGWNVAGISLTWVQAIRQFQSTYFVSYRTKDGTGEWSEWQDFQVNTEFVTNANIEVANEQRVFLSGAAGHDLLQLRFVYNADYYVWGIDDVQLVETECTNMRVQDNFFAIAPWATIPSNQVYPFGALADIRNAGACDQHNVVLNYTVTDTDSQEEIFNSNLIYGDVVADSTYENRLNPELISLPSASTNYLGTYTLTQNDHDFDSTDNIISYNFSVGGDVFGLEDGFTRSVAVNNGLYEIGAPLSFAFGNYFRPVDEAEVKRIVWGVNNPADMADYTVQIYLLQWTDINNNKIAESAERKFVGIADYTFTGDEGENAIIESILENFDDPGEPVIMQGGLGYIAIVEYQAASLDDPQFFMLASDARDYSAQVLAADTMVVWGLRDYVTYSSVLGFSPDGNIANIDYQVTELDVNDGRIFFGHDIIPLVRVVVDLTNTVDALPNDNNIDVYPNPATDQIEVKLGFTKPYNDVQLRLVDNQGRVVFAKAISQSITHHTETINVRNIPSGNYLLQVETVDGQRTSNVVIMK